MNRRDFLRSAAGTAVIPLVSEFLLGADAPDTLPITGRSQAELAGFDRMMSSFMKEHDVPGAALAVGRRGRIVYARGFGFADVEKKDPVQPDSLFRIASLSKSFTAAAILQLQERGKLHLADPAFKLLDLKPHLEGDATVDPRLAQITIAQLLHHTGGFDRGAKGSFDPMFRSIIIANATGVKPPAAQKQIIQYMMGRKLDFDPGTREAYSNFGYCVLGQIIEKLTGTPYIEYVQREILRPTGIHRMRLGRTLEADRALGEVRYYPRGDRQIASVYGDGKLVPAAYGGWFLEAMDSHGAWLASAPELVRYASSYDDPEHCPFLKSAAVKEMFARPQDTGFDAQGKPKPTYYACGWRVRPIDGGGINAFHTGLLDGAASLLVRRHDGLTWAVMFNRDRDTNKRIALGSAIDPLVHPVADAVKAWPEGWEFAEPQALLLPLPCTQGRGLG